MPTKAKKPCRHPGCPCLTDGLYCVNHAAEHKTLSDEQRKAAQRKYNREKRNKETAKQYNKRWLKIRTAYASEHPLCEECLKHGKTVPMQEVHHILPLSMGGKHEYENMISLCQSCHTKKDMELGVRTVFGRSVSPKDTPGG